ncbi:hypothetical protein V5T82_15180 [Magnetovibrio sp. PR-2]|uniref:hypothetical protein n=1 Tax=Magnetovibrio sp. PR-2 TaxID=3120356 RepID=UPI002FCE0C13
MSDCAAAPACMTCQSFVDDAEALEREIAGVNILSSAYGSVRADTGWCRRWDRFCVSASVCDEYQSRN